jgi:RNA polymerase sigma-70 factor (sigma-E family)
MSMTTRDEAFRAFFMAEGNRLERFATLLTGDPTQGADVAQEALVRVYTHWGRIRTGTPGAYARQIVVNLVRSAHRAKKRRGLKPVPSWAGGPGRSVDAPGDRIAERMNVTQALNELSPVRRATVVLRFYDDMSEHQIAEVLDRPLGTVKSDIHRALRQLRPLLEDANAGERRQ